MNDQEPAPLGWWTISGEELLAALHRVQHGDTPDTVYAELYANTDHEHVEPEPDPHGPVLLRLRAYTDGHVQLTTSHLTRELTLHTLELAITRVREFDGTWTTEHRDIT